MSSRIQSAAFASAVAVIEQKVESLFVSCIHASIALRFSKTMRVVMLFAVALMSSSR